MGIRYAIVLGHLMNRKGILSNTTKRRVRRGVSLLESGEVDRLIFSGASYRIDTSKSLASAMLEFTETHYSLDSNRIEIDTNARDTVGDAFFSRVRLEKNWGFADLEKIYIVSSSYHMNRVTEIFKFVFGDEIPMTFISVSSPLGFAHYLQEERSLKQFYVTFGGLASGDIHSIGVRLAQAHPLYMKD